MSEAVDTTPVNNTAEAITSAGADTRIIDLQDNAWDCGTSE